ncbi:hypothetical protein TcYC6_0073400 [Trypanosoma cruzi]|uniref:Uncharacterized protein n=1 Tax=Trypanosoma cruzi TaxID=5693 RepID=A0A7J6YBX2_TRYCR|nr:hypothetical protein ECC02_007516 [Trypanosoma cruzi]KAF5224197.1 hypothetical protein ECC02_002783 [Trypanosoma cruzi]KAF8298688.1 hypothetical protein TcYC6_0073400 [Trypanosoma cruzi]
MRRPRRWRLYPVRSAVAFIICLWFIYLFVSIESIGALQGQASFLKVVVRSSAISGANFSLRETNKTSALASSGIFSAVGSSRLSLLYNADAMIDLAAQREFNQTLCPTEPREKEHPKFVEFLEFFTRVFKEKYNNIPWWLDEGSLIGVGRAGAIVNADDDFDFFVLLPNATSPCRPGSLECTREEFNLLIHQFLLPLWEAGACIRRFTPDISKFDSERRLMYSFQIRKPNDLRDPMHCFNPRAPFAHMHFGMLNADGELETNKWVGPNSHPKDKLPLDLMLPVRRCRLGPSDAPCPFDIVGYLTLRNRGEYVRRSREGSCLLVKKKWSKARRVNQVKKVQLLHDCGYNSMIRLVKRFVDSDYDTC